MSIAKVLEPKSEPRLIETAKIFVDSSEEMNRRWFKIIKKHLPTIDLVDTSAEVLSFNA